MISLSNLSNGTRPDKGRKRKGRGPSSGMGKTSSRGQKGAGARSGYKQRYTYEGGQFRLFQKLPFRGFTRGKYNKKSLHAINLSLIDLLYSDGEVVSFETLVVKGYVNKYDVKGIKILANGEITKKVTIEATLFSKEAIRKIEEKKLSYKVLGQI